MKGKYLNEIDKKVLEAYSFLQQRFPGRDISEFKVVESEFETTFEEMCFYITGLLKAACILKDME